MEKSRFRIYIIGAIFLALISFPILNAEFKFVKDIESSENRKMTVKPEINYTYLDPYPAKYEKYYTDNFPLRSMMVKYFNILNIEVFQKSPVPDKVVIGKDGWLFMADRELKSYKGLLPFDSAELAAFKQELEYRKEYLAERNCKFYFMVAPIKALIYPEYMPNTVYRLGNQSWGEQLVEYLEENCEVKPINIYPVLREKKAENMVYFRLDNHWNKLGAFYSAVEFFKVIQKDFPGIEIPSIDDYTISKTEILTGNIISMLSNIGSYKDTTVNLEPKSGFRAQEAKVVGYPVIEGFPYPLDYEKVREIPGSAKPKILVITDSYGASIFPYIAEEFGRSVRIFDAWRYQLNEDIVNNEKPDVVLVIALEANLRNLLKYRSTLILNQVTN